MKNAKSIESNSSFEYVLKLITKAREKAIQRVNEELVKLYWNIGHWISRKNRTASYGDRYIAGLAAYIHKKQPELKGFDRRGLYRMKQFYETYKNLPKVSPLVTQLSWTNNLIILSSCKSDVEREFYIYLSIKERYSKRELERQIESGYFERFLLSNNTKLPEKTDTTNRVPFLDSYIFDFLDLPAPFKEYDLRKALIKQMQKFILELGKDFSFIGEEYKVQVGFEDYFIDLLFMHRELKCLVAVELKIGKFKPEYISKMDFYLEALDRQIKKPHENPSVGLILCASKDNEIVEYALSRTLSPLLVAEYKTKLPDKLVLEKKIQELMAFQKTGVDDD